MFDSMSRRDAIKAAMGAGLAAAAGAGLAGCATGKGQSAANPERDTSAGGAKRSCRIAHLTDMHIQPEKDANLGVGAAFAHVQSMNDRPAMIVTGGDTVMDSFDRDRARTALQWDLWKNATSSCRIPMRSVLGNHDIWGWNKSKSGTSGNEPGWGKAWGVEALAMPARFYAFDLPRESGARVGTGGWRCLMLDTVQPLGEDGYTAFVDPEQMEWLKGELAAANRPGGPYLFVVTHIPILSATVFIQKKQGRRTDITGGLMHSDAQELKDLFATCPNVRACVSGHMHLLDHVSYNGVEYFCNGAVSGGWWGGKNVDCDAGYAVMDLYDDGRVAREYVNYGWVART